MNNTIQKLDKLLTRYCDALETGNIKKQEVIYNEFLELKKDAKTNLDSLSKPDKKTFKMLCSEFRVLSSEQERNKLFAGIDKSKSKPKPQTQNFQNNEEYLSEAKNQALNTTSVLKTTLQELVEVTDIANNALVTINMDNNKLQNATNSMDVIQSQSKISMKLITGTLKRIYTDKLIIMFTFIVVCLIIVILLFKYKIIV
jgi:hypothetical protein